MKKIFNILLIAAATLGIASSCSDVPMPYDINNGTSSFGKKLPYKNASLSTFTTYNKTTYAAWSQGSSYTQATGYQAWDGASTKSNKEVESYLISPALCTRCSNGDSVRISFDQTIRYTSSVSGWEKYHKLYISKDYDGLTPDYEKAHWTELDYTPEASSYSDWTLYSSGYINVPAEFVNCDSVYVSFYFYAPSSASTTWELENFLIEEGNAGEKEDPTPSTDAKTLPYTSSNLYTDWNTYAVGKNNPWSQGSTYTQATGYQAWDGTTKSNQEAEGYLISPQISTVGATEVSISFDQTLRYTNNETGYADHSKIYVVKDWDGTGDPSKQALTELTGYKPTPSTYTDWTLYSSGNIALPAEFAGQENIHILFWFYAPASNSTTWELENFKIQSGSGGGDTPTPSEGGTKDNPYTVAQVNAFTSAGSYTNSNPSPEVYVKGIVSQIGDLNSTYGELNYYISDDGTTSNQFYVYNGYGLNGEKITSADYLKVGDVVLICGKTVTYSGTNEFTYGSKIITLNGKSSGGGGEDTPSGTSDGVSINETTVTLTNSAVSEGSNSVTMTVNDLGVADKGAASGTYNFSDGATLTIAQGEGKSAPTYYASSNGFRIYASNTLTFEGKSNIAKIVMECDSYSGTNYVGNTTATVSFSGNKAVYCNYNSANSGGTQLRVQKITIYYAASSAKKRAVRK